MECELCGHNEKLVKAEVEGALVSVCASCANLGRKVEIHYNLPDRPKLKIDQSEIRQDFSRLVRNARTSAGLSTEELAAKIGEKASIIERIEKGMRPTNDVAKKLEKALKVGLFGVEEIELESKAAKFAPSMADVAVIKTRKKH